MTHLSEEQLTAIKKDLEERLARFQKAFFERHGRNPDEHEREPAKPAIKRYRAVLQELARRQNAKPSAGDTATAVGEQVANQAQMAGMAAASAAPAAAAAREATRSSATAMAQSGGGAQASQAPSSLAKVMDIVRMCTPSAAMTDLLVSWGQFTAIFGDLTLSVSDQLQNDFTGLDISALAPWVPDLENHLWKYVNIFNLDIKSLQISLDLSFLK